MVDLLLLGVWTVLVISFTLLERYLLYMHFKCICSFNCVKHLALLTLIPDCICLPLDMAQKAPLNSSWQTSCMFFLHLAYWMWRSQALRLQPILHRYQVAFVSLGTWLRRHRWILLDKMVACFFFMLLIACWRTRALRLQTISAVVFVYLCLCYGLDSEFSAPSWQELFIISFGYPHKWDGICWFTQIAVFIYTGLISTNYYTNLMSEGLDICNHCEYFIFQHYKNMVLTFFCVSICHIAWLH